MTNSVNNSTLTKTLNRYLSVFKQKTAHLKEELILDPKTGFFWWLRTHHQKVALTQALDQLLQNARKPDFQFNHVTETLLAFKLKKDHEGQVKWYQEAHNQLVLCQKKLDDASILKIELIKPALTELKFISEADEFHQYFNLHPLQRRVQAMYEAITERMDTLLEYTKSKNLEHKTELDVREQEAKINLAKELTRQHEIQLEKEAAELKKVEVERELVDRQLLSNEADWEREAEARKLSLQEAQETHRQDIQNSMAEIQFDASTDDDMQQSQVALNSDQLIDALLKQIKGKELDRSDPKVKEQLQQLLQAIAGL